MKRNLILAGLVLLTIGLVIHGQAPVPQLNRQFSFASTGVQPAVAPYINVTNQGIGFYKIIYQVSGGTLSACTVKLEGSFDTFTWTDIVPNVTCTSDGQSVVTGIPAYSSYLRVNLSAFTRSSNPGALLTVTVQGWNNALGASASFPFYISGALGGIAQGATTVGQTGLMPLCNMTAAQPSAYTTATLNPFNCDLNGAQRVLSVTPYGGTGTLANSDPVNMATGQSLPFSWISDNSVTGDNIKGLGGDVLDLQVTTVLAAAAYVRLYNVVTDPPTCTSATGIIARFIIPAATTGNGGSFTFPVGKTFTTGIGFCATTTVGDTNNTAIGSNALALNLNYH